MTDSTPLDLLLELHIADDNLDKAQVFINKTPTPWYRPLRKKNLEAAQRNIDDQRERVDIAKKHLNAIL